MNTQQPSVIHSVEKQFHQTLNFYDRASVRLVAEVDRHLSLLAEAKKVFTCDGYGSAQYTLFVSTNSEVLAQEALFEDVASTLSQRIYSVLEKEPLYMGTIKLLDQTRLKHKVTLGNLLETTKDFQLLFECVVRNDGEETPPVTHEVLISICSAI
jgi:hypothetical protein